MAIGYVYKILYDSNNKSKEFQKLKEFLNALTEFACIDVGGMNIKNSFFVELRDLSESEFSKKIVEKIRNFSNNDNYNSLAVNYFWGLCSSELILSKRIELKNKLSVDMLKYKSNF